MTRDGMKLVIEDEAGTRSVVPFAGDSIVVGRGTDGVTFRLYDRNISRLHARFLRQNGNVFVEDLGSLTGTRVNGERIASRRRVREGDLVQIGDYDLVVMRDEAIVDGAPPLPAPPRHPERAPITLRVAAVEPTPAATVPRPAPAPEAPRGRTLRIAVAAGIVALALGAAAGLAVGAFTAPAAPPISRP